MAVVEVLATGERFEGVDGTLLAYYQGEAVTVGGYTIDGVEYPRRVDVSDFDPADHTVAEVAEHLTRATPAERDRVLAAEAAAKARVTLLNGVDEETFGDDPLNLEPDPTQPPPTA